MSGILFTIKEHGTRRVQGGRLSDDIYWCQKRYFKKFLTTRTQLFGWSNHSSIWVKTLQKYDSLTWPKPFKWVDYVGIYFQKNVLPLIIDHMCITYYQSRIWKFNAPEQHILQPSHLSNLFFFSLQDNQNIFSNNLECKYTHFL